MAIIKLGTLITGIRGTAGGNTFSANKAGPYVKTWQRPPIATSVAQATANNLMTSAASAWRDLTQSQRDDWDTWADMSAPARFNSLGEPLALSGFQWFVSLNNQLLSLDEPIREDAPTLPEPAAPDITNVRVSTDNDPTTLILWTDGDFSGFWLWFAVAQAFTQAVTSFSRSNYFIIRKKNIGLGGTNIFGLLENQFGSIELGRRWFFQIRKINAQGLLGPPFLEYTDTVA